MEGLNAEFSQRFQRLKAAVEARGGTLSIFSGGRDRAKQAELYAAALKKYGSEKEARRWVASPGKSNHDTEAGMKYGMGTGALAADISGSKALAHELAPQFGLSFPLANEDWHIEQAGIRQMAASGAPKGNVYSALAEAAAQKYGIDPALFNALINQESKWNPRATSGAGAQGLTQLMPGTAAGLGVKDPYDPEQNLMGGAKYLSQMLKQFNGDTKMALAAYNAGPGNVAKYKGIPPFPETQAYVRNVLGAMGQGGIPATTPAGGVVPGGSGAAYTPSQDTNLVSALAQRILASNNELINTPRTYGAPKFNIMSSMRGAV